MADFHSKINCTCKITHHSVEMNSGSPCSIKLYWIIIIVFFNVKTTWFGVFKVSGREPEEGGQPPPPINPLMSRLNLNPKAVTANQRVKKKLLALCLQQLDLWLVLVQKPATTAARTVLPIMTPLLLNTVKELTFKKSCEHWWQQGMTRWGYSSIYPPLYGCTDTLQ